MNKIKVDDFPYCCKSFILKNFPYDKESKFFYEATNPVYKYYTKEEIEASIKKDLDSFFCRAYNWEYEEYCIIAAVTQYQSYAKSILEEFGFTVFNTTRNPDSDDEVVYFMSKLAKNGEDFTTEEEEEEEGHWYLEND